MANNPTVIVGSLNDKELKEAIDKLVGHVEQGTKKMTDSFDSAVEHIKNSLKSLGDTKIDLNLGNSSGSKSGDSNGSKARSQSQKAETKAVEDTAAAYDNLATAIERAKGRKNTETYVSEVSNFRQTAETIARQIKEAETALQTAVTQRVTALNESLERAKQKLHEYNTELAKANERAAREGTLYSPYNADISRAKQGIEIQLQAIEKLKQKIAEAPSVVGAEELQRINQMKQELSNIQMQIQQLIQAERQQAQQDLRAEHTAKVTAEYEKQKELIDQIASRKDATKAFEKISLMPSGTMEEMQQKMELLQQLIAKVKDTPFMSQANVNAAKRQLGSVSSAYSLLKDEKEKAAAAEAESSEKAVAATKETTKETEKLAESEKKVQQAAMGTYEIFDNLHNAAARSNQILAQQRATAAGKTTAPMQFTEYNDLREAIAKLLNVKKEEIVQADTETDSNNKLRQSLAQITAAYDKLTTTEQQSMNGKRLAGEMRLINRELENRAKAAKRPELQEAMRAEERSVAQLARKISMLKQVQQDLDVTNSRSRIVFNQVSDEITRLTKRQNELMGSTQRLAGSYGTLDRAVAYMKNRLAFYLTVGATTSFVNQLVEVRSQYELTERALGVLIDSAEKGSQIFKELSDMALVSPYTLIELSQAARMLTAYGVTASNVVDTTRRLADISAAVGVPINNIAYALGHVQSYGYLTSLQARQFANAGIPLVKALAEEYTKLEGKMVSITDVYARMKHKQVSYADVMQVVNSMTDEGGRFFDFQAKTADTLKVQLANLTLAWNNMLNEMGESYQWLIELPIKGLKSLFLAWESISGIVNQVVIGFGLYKAAQLVMNAAIGISYRSLNKQALATKKAAAAQLRKEAVTRNLSAAEKKIIANSRVATIEDYKRELSTRKLTASQAKLLVANNKKNIALHKAIIQTRLLKETEVQAALATNVWSLRLTVLGERLKMAGVAMKEFMSSNWIMLLLGVLTEVGMAIHQNIREQKEFNEGIANGAKEAAKSFKDFYYSFKKGTTTAELQKNWEALREQILTNSAAGEIFVERLSKTEDAAKRVGDALDYTKRIQEISEAMSTLTNELNVHAGTVWWQGEEGLDEDLQDYQEKFDKIARKIKEGGFESIADANALDDYFKEAEKEVKNFAEKAYEQLKNVLTPEDMDDSVKVREALSRIEAEILKEYPKIKGVAKQMFLLETDKIFEEETGGVIKQSETIQNQILELLKQTNASAFSTLTDASEALNNEQLKAINRTIEEYKSRVPSEWHALIDELASQDWLIPVKAKMEVTPMDPAQKESYMHFIGDTEKEAADIREEYSKHSFEATMAYLKAGWGKTLTEEEERMLLLYDKNEAAQSKLNKARQTYTTLLRKQGESILDYEKRLTEQRKEAVDMLAREKLIMATLTDTSSERYIQAKTEKEKLQEAIDALDAVAEYEGLNILGKQKKGSKKDILGDAFSKEVQYISDIQKRIKEYRKMGVDAQTAQAKATEEYGKSISNNNEILKKYRVQTLSADKLTNMSLQDIRDFYKEQVKVAQQLKNTKGVEALEKAIASLNVEITKLDYKRIVDGLNQELSKIKDEYELAIELSANPELGDMFTSMFGIDTDTLPRTFKEAYDRANKVAIDALKELKVEVANFDLMSAAFVGDEENKWHGLELDSDPMKELIKDQKTWRDMYKKNLTETEKALDDYVEKYGGEEDKMAQIEADRLEKLRKLDDAYYTEGMRKRAEYIAKLDAINKGAQKEQASVRFDSFKNSDLYVQMFENLDYISTSTLKRMREKLEELKTSMGELKPEQLKQIVQQIEKLDQQLSERTEPFSNLGKNALNYIKLLKERSKVEKQATEKQSEVDKQQKVVNLLEQQHEQLKRKEGVTKKELDYSNGNLTIQKGILKAMKEALAPLLEKLGLIKYANEALHNALNQTSQWLGVAKDLNSTIMDVADSLGASEATKEVLSDIGAMLEGIDQVVQGFDDLISLNPVKTVGGVVKIFGGIWKSIATWFDNSNKKIDRQIQDSEKHVKKLEQAYNSLEHTIEKAMGTAETSARREAIANKKLQLEELKTQLVLERSRESKYQDEEKIMDLEGRITDLTNDINDMIDDVASNLAGSDIKSAAESFVDAWVDAWKEGETTLDAIEEKMDEMIFNIIKKSASAAIVGKLLQPFYDALDEYTSAASEGGEELTTGELKKLGTLASKLGIDINEALGAFYGNLEGLDIISKNIKDKDLSQLQQGIQSITEDTAGALEAYMNGVSQQVYLQSDLLTEIRNAVATMDNDAQLGTQAQMLLQLQQSYAVQVAIRNIMEGWTNASGMAVRVEMI